MKRIDKMIRGRKGKRSRMKRRRRSALGILTCERVVNQEEEKEQEENDEKGMRYSSGRISKRNRRRDALGLLVCGA